MLMMTQGGEGERRGGLILGIESSPLEVGLHEAALLGKTQPY